MASAFTVLGAPRRRGLGFLGGPLFHGLGLRVLGFRVWDLGYRVRA